MCIADAGYTSKGGEKKIILKMSDVIFCESVQTYLFIVITSAENSETKLKLKKTLAKLAVISGATALVLHTATVRTRSIGQ